MKRAMLIITTLRMTFHGFLKWKKLSFIGMLCLAGLGLIGKAKASTLYISLHCNDEGVSNSSVYLSHHSIPILFEYSFLSMWPPCLDMFYMKDGAKMMGIADLPDSMETEIANIEGRGLDSPVSAELSTNIFEASVDGELPENNMIGKKVIGKLYEVVGGTDVLEGTYNCWNMTYTGQKVALTVKNGLSHKWVTEFYNTNIADFNNDGKVDLSDFAILANDYRKGLGNYLTDISGHEGQSDGNIDMYDLALFANEWLTEDIP